MIASTLLVRTRPKREILAKRSTQKCGEFEVTKCEIAQKTLHRVVKNCAELQAVMPWQLKTHRKSGRLGSHQCTRTHQNKNARKKNMRLELAKTTSITDVGTHVPTL